MAGKTVDFTVDKVTIGAVSTGPLRSNSSLRRAIASTPGCETVAISSCPRATCYGATLVLCGGKVKMAV